MSTVWQASPFTREEGSGVMSIYASCFSAYATLSYGYATKI